MTDLERAHKFIQEHFDCQDVICTFALGCGCAAQLADALAAARDEALEEAARIAENRCLVPPDGGSPTAEERKMCEYIAAAIRALKDKP